MYQASPETLLVYARISACSSITAVPPTNEREHSGYLRPSDSRITRQSFRSSAYPKHWDFNTHGKPFGDPKNNSGPRIGRCDIQRLASCLEKYDPMTVTPELSDRVFKALLPVRWKSERLQLHEQSVVLDFIKSTKTAAVKQPFGYALDNCFCAKRLDA